MNKVREEVSAPKKIWKLHSFKESTQPNWLAFGVIPLILGFLLDIGHGFNSWDEAWFLQVIDRVSKGDALYRDIFFGITALSVYVSSAFTAIFGSEVKR